jgi:hypothetical protein
MKITFWNRILTLTIIYCLSFSLLVSSVQADDTVQPADKVQSAADPATDSAATATPPAPPTDVKVQDTAWDNGDSLTVVFVTAPNFNSAGGDVSYIVERSEEEKGMYTAVGTATVKSSEKPSPQAVTIPKCNPLVLYFFRVHAEQGNAKSADVPAANALLGHRQWFEGSRLKILVYMFVVVTTILVCIILARNGMTMYVRRIAGLDALDEAVGRATEMGKPCLFVPGVNDLNEIQTIAGITILSKVTQTAADLEAQIEVPTSRSLVMTAARETMQTAYMTAGRPDAFNPDSVYYVTDEQFGYVAYITGYMVREKPSACFYFGAFFAESLILAETGNAIGAIQVCGTAQTSQLPFFVAACDYTLIGEELFAASAYLSGSPEELGSLKGQDVCKMFLFAFLIISCIYLESELIYNFMNTK